MDFWERIRDQIRIKNTTQEWVAKQAGVPFSTFKRWLNARTMPNADQAYSVAHVLETTVEYLIAGELTPDPQTIRNPLGTIVELDGEAVFIPILSQKVSAGHGQEALHDLNDIIGQLPFLKKMLRGGHPKDARALEVRGDSMTGINLFDGDLVVFMPGLIRGDGIYVLQVGDDMIVKRVEFDLVSRKLRIMSENPRYPDRVESADGQLVFIVGKVYGWVHSHPY